MRLFGRRTAMTIGTVRIEEQLHIEFDCSRTLKRDPNKLIAKIYNLSEQTRGKIAGLDENARVSFEAGYKTTQLAEIFRGYFVTGFSQKSGTDIITTVESSDGGQSQFATHNKSFRKGTTVRSAIEDLVATAEIDPGNMREVFERDTVLATATLTGGCVVAGNAFTTAQGLLSGLGYSASLQNNQLQILKNGAALPGRAILLNADTGLIGTPSVSTDNRTKTKRVRFESLMITDIAPGKQVRLESLAFTGGVVVDRAQYRGGLDSQDFGIAIEGDLLS